MATAELSVDLFSLFQKPRSASLVFSTKTLEAADPADWRAHHFGLSSRNWANLADKYIWITGAGSGFGQAMALGCAAAGANVILSGRNSEKLRSTIKMAADFKIDSEKFSVVPFDLTRPEEIENACVKVRGLCSSLYGLVNNSALAPRGKLPLQTESLEFWNLMLQTNLTAPWWLTKTIAPHMMNGAGARILMVTSEAGWAHSVGHGNYNVSKAALNNLTASFASELAEQYPDGDVQVNALVPGEARTEMNQGSINSPFTVVSMALMLLSQSRGGPNGKFFHRDGRHLSCGYSTPFERSLNKK